MKYYATYGDGNVWIFDSLADAELELERRVGNWDGGYPNSKEVTMQVYYDSPMNCPDPQPNKIVYITKGGYIRECTV